MIPCIARGGPGSVYPGVYMSMCHEIDVYNQEKYGWSIEEQAEARVPHVLMFGAK